MTKKLYYNLREKYKVCKAFCILYMQNALHTIDFNSTIRKKMHWVVQLFGNEVIERISLTSRNKHPN